MEIVFNNKGLPVMMSSDKIFATTIKGKSKVAEDPKETFSFKEKEFVCWGPDNRYPDEAVRVIGKTGVLSTAIGFKSRTSFGQGVVPMDVSGYSENGEMQLTPCQDKDIQLYFRSYEFRQYMSNAFRDLFKFGNCFPIFYFNEDGTKIVRLILRNARHCRISKDKQWLCVYPNYDESFPTEKDTEVIRMLDEDDPFLELDLLNIQGKLKGRPVAFPRIRNYFSNNDYYGIPDWDAAWKSGWVDIAHRIPQFLAKSYANAMTLMWHIQIPDDYWENHFPENEYPDKNKKKQAIEEAMQEIEDSLCGVENANKALFSEYSVEEYAKVPKEWKIERLKNEIDAKERLSTSAAANSEILFSLMLNPSVLGAGMPGGAYAGNAGSGSDIRESFLVSVITTYIEKQQVLDPVMLMLRFNGHGDDLVLKYKETILTTLNTGQAKEEITT